MRVFTEADVTERLPMAGAIAAVEESLLAWARGEAQNLPRRRLFTPAGAGLHVMSAAVRLGGRWFLGCKVYSTGQVRDQFTVNLYDGESGEPLARFEADRLGQRRTGAATGVATRLLAPAGRIEVGLIGAGWQAESQIEAVCAVCDVAAVRVYSRDAGRRARFAESMAARLGVGMAHAPSAAAAVEGAGVVVTATSSRAPVLPDAALAAEVHINAMGANLLRRAEIEPATLRRADRILVDSLEQCRQEAGDLAQAFGNDDWPAAELGPALAMRAIRRPEERLTVFKSTGLALWDVACAARIYTDSL